MLGIFGAIFLAWLATVSSPAYFVASYGAAVDRAAPSNIFVVGYSHGMGRRLLEAAAGSALRIQSAVPGRQVVFLVIEETADSRADLERLGLVVKKDTATKLSPAALVEELKTFSRIASVELFTHSHVLWGAGLEGLKEDERINHETPGLAELRANFLPDAYVFFHGCNAGFVIAPALAEIWGIPVAGALSSTSIERLARSGHWYLDEKGNGPWAKVNAVSFPAVLPCSTGACVRMRPDDHPYMGKYGRFARGLGFYRFFCPAAKRDACSAAMVQSLFAFPAETPLAASSGESDFDKVVREFLCSSVTPQRKRDACRSGISPAKGNLPDPFLGMEPYCTREFCEVEVACSGLCRIGGAVNSFRHLLDVEYRRYRRPSFSFEVRP